MGQGDGDGRLLDADREDLALQRVLTRYEQPEVVAPPPDFVTRTMRRLPATVPAARVPRRWRKRHMFFVGWTVVALVFMLGIFGALGLPTGGPGRFSRAWLAVSLLARPVVHALFAAPWAPLVALLALAFSIGAWLWLVRRTPVVRPTEVAL